MKKHENNKPNQLEFINSDVEFSESPFGTEREIRSEQNGFKSERKDNQFNDKINNQYTERRMLPHANTDNTIKEEPFLQMIY